MSDKDGHLSIVSESNAGNPLKKGLKPLLVIDVWEHAYYIDYRNRRAAFIEAFWTLVDWQKEDKLFENQQLLRQPIVRNGRQAAVGYCPEVWEKWE